MKRSQFPMLQFVYIWVLDSFTIKELIICLQYHAWIIHIYQFTICLQFISCLVIIRNNTYRYTMLLSNVEHVDHMRRRLHKRRYNLLNVNKLISSINILLPPENVSDGLLGACNNCRITRNYISLIFGRAITEKLVMALHIFYVYTFRIFIRYSNYSAHLYDMDKLLYIYRTRPFENENHIYIYIMKEINFENFKKGWKQKQFEDIAS